MFDKKAKAPKPTREEKKDRRIPLSKFTEGGRTSCLIALCNLAFLALIITTTIIEDGKSGIFVGLMMIFTFFSSIFGFIVGITSFDESNKFLKFSYIGSGANGAIWVGILLLYLTYV